MAIFTELSLFSGAGGGLLATKHLLGWRTICYVEWDKYAVDVLKARIRDGYLDDAPIWDDAFTFDGRPWAGCVDIVTAGFPCQPFSSAGRGLAELDPRNGWPALIRILREVRPRYALLENVPRLLTKPYYRRILSDLAEAGFDCEQDCITAEEMGANHKRDRLWIVATNTNIINRVVSEITRFDEEKILIDGDGTSQLMANTYSRGWKKPQAQPEVKGRQSGLNTIGEGPVCNTRDQGNRQFQARSSGGQEKGNFYSPQWWEIEPELGRVADGVAHWVDRLRAIGNGQVPAVVREAWRRLGGGE